MGEFAVSIEHSEAKSDPRYRLALHALAMPPLPNPKYATDYEVAYFKIYW